MKILIAIDGSPSSDAAVAEIAGWPSAADREIRVVTADAPVDPGLLKGTPVSAFDEIIRQQQIESTKRLRGAVAVLQKSTPEARITSSLLEGWPKDAIVSEAERWGADLVVVGSHGYGPIRRFFLGSVSLFVAHNAPCSVLIVRQR